MTKNANKKHRKEIRRPDCPMSSVSAWSTAAAVRGTTARARQESPVISADDGLYSGFPWGVSFCLIRRGVKEVNLWISALQRYIPMAILGKYDERLSIPQVFHIPLLYK